MKIISKMLLILQKYTVRLLLDYSRKVVQWHSMSRVASPDSS